MILNKTSVFFFAVTRAQKLFPDQLKPQRPNPIQLKMSTYLMNPFKPLQKWKYFSIQRSPISETALLFFKVPMLHQFDILVKVECRWTNDEQYCAT